MEVSLPRAFAAVGSLRELGALSSSCCSPRSRSWGDYSLYSNHPPAVQVLLRLGEECSFLSDLLGDCSRGTW